MEKQENKNLSKEQRFDKIKDHYKESTDLQDEYKAALIDFMKAKARMGELKRKITESNNNLNELLK